MSLPILQERPVHAPGAIEAALHDVWQRERTRLYRWQNLPALLRLHRRFSLRTLRVSDVKVMIPTGQVPDCDNCVDLCCTGPDAVVSLRLRDIAVLLDRGLAAHIAWERPPTPPASTWARREADGSVFHRAFPVLARDATGTCLFLDDNRLCGLWPSWPLSCARYPYALDLQSKVVFYARSCTSTRVAAYDEAPLRARELVRAVVDAYNARVRDVVVLAVAGDALRELGLLAHVRLEELGL